MKRIEDIIEVPKGDITYVRSLAEVFNKYLLLYGNAFIQFENLEDKTLIHVFVEIEDFKKEEQK